MSATFVGFGFGPIQTGLLLFEAVQSGSFDRFVVAEVDQRLVDAVRAAGDEVVVNIAGKNGIRTGRIPKVELCNPQVTWDRSVLVEAIVDADEMGTAVPSVDLYSAGKDASIAAMLQAGPEADHLYGGKQQLRSGDPSGADRPGRRHVRPA
jgi:hypothetical protein